MPFKKDMPTLTRNTLCGKESFTARTKHDIWGSAHDALETCLITLHPLAVPYPNRTEVSKFPGRRVR